MRPEWNDGRSASRENQAPLVMTGLVRGINKPPEVVWAVSPMGIVKPIYFTMGVTPWLLDIKWIRRGNRIIGIQRVTLKADALDKGWRLLEELYKAEDRLADYQTFLRHREQIVSRGVRTEIPDEYLPQALLDFRTRIKAEAGIADLPAPQGAGDPAPDPDPQRPPTAEEAFG